MVRTGRRVADSFVRVVLDLGIDFMYMVRGFCRSAFVNSSRDMSAALHRS